MVSIGQNCLYKKNRFEYIVPHSPLKWGSEKLIACNTETNIGNNQNCQEHIQQILSKIKFCTVFYSTVKPGNYFYYHFQIAKLLVVFSVKADRYSICIQDRNNPILRSLPYPRRTRLFLCNIIQSVDKLNSNFH